jgi:PAS domain S-box-containing protein
VSLDIRTILVSFVVTSAVNAGIVTSLWVRTRVASAGRGQGTGLWLANAALQLVAVIVIAMRGTIPVTVSILLGNPLLVAGQLLLWRGLGVYTGRTTSLLAHGAILAAVIASQLYFTLVVPSLVARNIILAAAGVVVSVMSALLLLTRRTGAERIESLPPGILFCVQAAVSVARIVADLAVPPGTDLFTAGLYDALVLLAYQVLTVSLTFGLLLTVNSRLLLVLRRDMARRERMEKSLRESEQKFSVAFRTSPIALAITRADSGTFLDVNEAFLSMTGITGEQAGRESARDLSRETGLEGFERIVAAAGTGGTVRGEEVRFHRTDGTPMTGLLSAHTVRMGGEDCILSSVVDITARKSAEALAAARARQQQAIAELGSLALAGAGLAEVMDRAVRSVARVLDVDLCKVLELSPDGRSLALRAGVGWKDGLVGAASVPADPRSQAGYTLRCREPVVVEDVAREGRFSAPALLQEHGVVSGMSVLVGSPEKPFGVLGAHATTSRRFTAEDVHFVRAAANLLASVVQRGAHEAEIVRLGRLYATLSRVNQAVIRRQSRAELGADVCRASVEEAGFTAAWIGWFDRPGAPPQVLARHCSADRDPAPLGDLARSCAGIVEAVRTGEPLVCRDVSGDLQATSCREGLLEVGIRSCAAFPLRLAGTVRGALVVCAEDQRFVAGETQLLEEVASDISFALDRLDREGQHRRLHDALRQSEARFRGLYEQSPVGYQSLDADGRILDVNPAWLALLGYAREEVVGRQFVELLSPASGPVFLERFPRFRELGAAHGTEFEMVRRDGQLIVASFDGVFVRDAQGRPLYTHCVLHNVSERARAERELRRLTTAIEQAGEAVFVTDRDGLIQYVNPAFESVTGWPREEALGKTPRILKSGAQDPRFYEALWRAITAGRTWNGRLVNRRRDGTQYTEEATISPVRDPSGTVTNFVAVKRDISGQLALESQLRQAQKMESVGRLAGGVAHDFNNMLQVILSYASLASSSLGPGHAAAGFMGQIRRAAERSAELTQQLLAFARKQVISPRPLDLNATVEGMLSMVRRLVGEDIELAWRPGTGLGLVRMDPAQVGQVVTNLCVNARDAIATVGSVTIATRHVHLDEAFCASRPGSTPGDFAALEVADSGCGMDADTLDRIFEPFFTTKEEGKGTGLGLATVYGIVKQNGGFIDVHTRVGEGSAFRIYLPRLEGALSPAAEVAPSPPRGHGETVLVVEDEPAILAIARQVLDTLGYRALAASSPEEALAAAGRRGGKIDVLLTDVIMPGMNGRELYERLAAARPALRCLYMSGYTADVIADRGVLEPDVQFIAKPFSTADLALTLRDVLDRPAPRRGEQALAEARS